MSGKYPLIIITLLVITIGLVPAIHSQNHFPGPENETGALIDTSKGEINTGSTTIPLDPDTLLNSDFILTGYVLQNKRYLAGAHGKISGNRIRYIPVSNVSNTLGGLLPGLIVVTPGGEPGADGSTLRIRGNHTLGDNSPLIVIDGMPNRPGGLDRLNPQDIESITILRDATAAIYGSQAANGVILVTTRRGEPGKPKFNVRMNQGFNQPTRIPMMADAPTYLRMLNEIESYRGFESRYSEAVIQCHAEQSDPWRCPDTDWFSESLKTVSLQSKADFSVHGGGKILSYYLSAGGLTEDGYYRNSATRYSQLNYRSNFDIQVADDVQFGLSVSGRYEDRNFTSLPASDQFRMLMRGKPNMPAYWPNGLPAPDIENGINPVVSATPEAGYNNEKRLYLQGQLRIDVEIPEVEGLLLRGTIGYDKYYSRQSILQKPWTLYSWDYFTLNEYGEPDLRPYQRGFSERQLFQESDRGNDFLMNYLVSYQRENFTHSYSFLAGSEYHRLGESGFNELRRYFPSDKSRFGYFFSLNYAYEQKYLIGFTGRIGGSHMFQDNGNDGFFPSVSAGWRPGREKWFRKLFGFFDELKIHGSWGRTGNDSVMPWQMSTVSAIADSEIRWETATQFNAGIEAGFMQNRLSFEVDYFHYLRSDILWWRGTVTSQAGSSVPENFGQVVSRGFDGSVALHHRFNQDVQLKLNLTGVYAVNEIRFLDESSNTPGWQKFTGMPVNSGLYYNVIGVFEDQEQIEMYPGWPGAQPGDLIFEDITGDGVINARDMVRIGKSSFPKWTFGFDMGADYKQFDFRLFFQGAFGAQVYTQTESGTIGNFRQDFAGNRWTPDSPVSDHPRTWNRTDEYWASQPNTYFLSETDYVRLKSLEIGYHIPEEMTERLGLNGMRFYLSGFNILTIDSLKIMDPEAGSGNGQYYPQRRVFNAGLSVSF